MVVGLYFIIICEEYLALDSKKVTLIHTIPQAKFALKYPTQSKKSWAYKTGKRTGKQVIERTNYSTI